VHGGVYAELPASSAEHPEEHPEITKLRVQQEVDKVRRQYEKEIERERRKQMSSDIEILAEKISTAKQFELDTLHMVQKLKEAGTLDPDEESMLKELIKDKVMEEFHVDRRGERSRSFS
jgi:hypothetical protein